LTNFLSYKRAIFEVTGMVLSDKFLKDNYSDIDLEIR